ncbi:hypothetical protein HI914_00531 [Erysiphe necator]|uniref:Uncharacterized protein n=1 Tax=Uncinula necator TaxID=52586 RepID=A0A0B1P653_UNCNE|nr:hypothetical protein HI914_00531 [Erysiphe necator]KHJ32159.1 hypothetical protein EV44_g0626 [Erysiphe necator]
MAKLPIRNITLLQARNEQHNSSTMINLLITLLVLIFISLILTAVLLVARTIRRRRALSRHYLASPETNYTQNHQHLSMKTTFSRSSSYSIYEEKKSPLNTSSSLSSESVPEIRITFPDEQDESGRRMSGRVVVVRVGEAGIGLEPLRDEEQLPAYEEGGGRFHSIDIDQIGGLKEK